MRIRIDLVVCQWSFLLLFPVYTNVDGYTIFACDIIVQSYYLNLLLYKCDNTTVTYNRYRNRWKGYHQKTRK